VEHWRWGSGASADLLLDGGEDFSDAMCAMSGVSGEEIDRFRFRDHELRGV
jgi:hypothetical protein